MKKIMLFVLVAFFFAPSSVLAETAIKSQFLALYCMTSDGRYQIPPSDFANLLVDAQQYERLASLGRVDFFISSPYEVHLGPMAEYPIFGDNPPESASRQIMDACAAAAVQQIPGLKEEMINSYDGMIFVLNDKIPKNKGGVGTIQAAGNKMMGVALISDFYPGLGLIVHELGHAMGFPHVMTQPPSGETEGQLYEINDDPMGDLGGIGYIPPFYSLPTQGYGEWRDLVTWEEVFPGETRTVCISPVEEESRGILIPITPTEKVMITFRRQVGEYPAYREGVLVWNESSKNKPAPIYLYDGMPLSGTMNRDTFSVKLLSGGAQSCLEVTNKAESPPPPEDCGVLTFIETCQDLQRQGKSFQEAVRATALWWRQSCRQ